MSLCFPCCCCFPKSFPRKQYSCIVLFCFALYANKLNSLKLYHCQCEWANSCSNTKQFHHNHLIRTEKTKHYFWKTNTSVYLLKEAGEGGAEKRSHKKRWSIKKKKHKAKEKPKKARKKKFKTCYDLLPLKAILGPVFLKSLSTSWK